MCNMAINLTVISPCSWKLRKYTCIDHPFVKTIQPLVLLERTHAYITTYTDRALFFQVFLLIFTLDVKRGRCGDEMPSSSPQGSEWKKVRKFSPLPLCPAPELGDTEARAVGATHWRHFTPASREAPPQHIGHRANERAAFSRIISAQPDDFSAQHKCCTDSEVLTNLSLTSNNVSCGFFYLKGKKFP